jgi:Ca2+-binding RTX toxin-like protein
LSKTGGRGIPQASRKALAVLAALVPVLILAPAAAASHLPGVPGTPGTPGTTPDGVSLETYTPPPPSLTPQVSGPRSAQETRIVYKAGDGQSNVLAVTETATDYVFTESGAVSPVTLDPTAVDHGCTVAGGVTTCPKDGIDSIAVVLGDEPTPDVNAADDLIDVSAVPPRGTWIDGGTGNDDINSGAGHEDVFGREGIDVIFPGLANDWVMAGPSRAATARFQTADGGGSGFDTVRYDDRIGGVSIEAAQLARDSDTTACPPAPPVNPLGGCLELLSSNVDKIVGSPGNDEIIASTGNSVLAGLGGSDVLCGGMGVDTVDYSESPQGVNVTLSGAAEAHGNSDPRATAPVFGGGLAENRKSRRDCRAVDPANPRGDPIPSPVIGNPFGQPGAPGRDCNTVNGLYDDGAPGEHDCVGEDVENIVGSRFDDTLVGNDPDVFEGLGPKVEPHGINDIEGGGGDDLIDGRFGPDTLSGGPGDDTVTYADRVMPVSAAIDGAPNDGSSERDQACTDALIAWTAANVQPPFHVVLIGGGDLQCSDFDFRTGQSDSLEGDVENIIGTELNVNTLGGDGEANLLVGGPLADFIDGHGGDDDLDGGDGPDTIMGGDGADALLGGPGDDVLDGENHDDDVQGEGEDDTVKGGGGSDTLGGGDGNDLVDFSEATTSVHVSADGVRDDGRAGELDNVGSDFEIIVGGSDKDVLEGGPASESILGGDGDDLLSGGGGADALSGGAGTDGVSYAAAGGPVFVNLAEAGNDGEAGEGDDIATDVEEVRGGPGDDTLLGNGADNILLGGDGNDRLAGAEGDDILVGGLGDDSVAGDVGADTVYGSDGADNLTGGDGNDDLKGESGNDSLDGGTGADRHTGGPDTDTILYSSRSAGVSVNLDGVDKNGQSNENDFINNDVENVTTGRGPDTIDSDDNKRSEVRCGAGADAVTADPDDRVNADCENVQVSALGTRCSASTARVNMAKSGAIPVRVFCAVDAKGSLRLQSVARVRASKGKRRILKLGSKSFSLKAGQRRTITVRASKAARRYIQRKRRLSLRARVTARATGKKAALRSSSVFTVRARR